MKSRSYTFTAVIFVCLTAACTLVGRSTESAPPANQQAPEIPAAAASDATAKAPAQQRVGTIFKGSVGESKIEMDIKRSGGDLTGSYHYIKSGSTNRLTLKGKIGSDGNFSLQESDPAGKPTGEFKGKWKEDSNESGASLEGEWLKPGQKSEGLGFFAWEQMIYSTSTQITSREIKESIKPKKATLAAEYPEVTGGPNAAAFNQLAKARVMESLSAFRKDVAAMTAEDVKMMSQTGVGPYMEVGYNVEYADDELISVSFSESAYMGGAHPSHNSFTLAYDLKRGRELKLADLFKPGSKFLPLIADIAAADLKSRKDPESGENLGIAQDLWEDGVKPTADNYRNWNLTKKGLLLTFPPYQVAAYAFGEQSVIIPYAKLKDIASPDGPLAKFKM